MVSFQLLSNPTQVVGCCPTAKKEKILITYDKLKDYFKTQSLITEFLFSYSAL